jgi:hypothetical protein
MLRGKVIADGEVRCPENLAIEKMLASVNELWAKNWQYI